MEARTRTSQAVAQRPRGTLEGARVALVHDWLTGLRGGEKCLEVLCREFPDATLHTLIHRRGFLSAPIERMDIRTTPLQRFPGVFHHYRHLLPVMPMAARAWDVDGADLVISLSHCVAKAVYVPPGAPHVCYCFTPMRYAWDGRDAYLQSWRDRPVRRRVAGWMLNRLREWDRQTASRVTDFVAISETVKARIKRCYDRESHVIPPPVDTEFYRPADVEREAFYLVVSALVPYKKVDHAVEASVRSGHPLIVIGEGPDRDRLERIGAPWVRFLGWQPDEVIRDHLQRCRALLFPGEEDFGIVPIEALACGSPVIALGRGGVAETVDDVVGRLYDDASPDGLLTAIDAWEIDDRPFDVREARRRAERFSAPLFRDRLVRYLADVVSRGRVERVPPPPHLAVSAAASRETV
jgi:glycosyltransferase involved in cell wall biosynthesis